MKIKYLSHACFEVSNGKTILFDPYFSGNSLAPKYEKKADLILITHDHFDHCSEADVRKLIKDTGIVIATKECVPKLEGLHTKILEPGMKVEVKGIRIEAVDAYNVKRFRSPGVPFHQKSKALGYVITVAGKRIYHAGDTDMIPEMSNLTDIDVAMLPVGGTYTMDEDEAVNALKLFKPKLAIPMHFNTFPLIRTRTHDFKMNAEKSGLKVKVLAIDEEMEI